MFTVLPRQRILKPAQLSQRWTRCRWPWSGVKTTPTQRSQSFCLVTRKSSAAVSHAQHFPIHTVTTAPPSAKVQRLFLGSSDASVPGCERTASCSMSQPLRFELQVTGPTLFLVIFATVRRSVGSVRCRRLYLFVMLCCTTCIPTSTVSSCVDMMPPRAVQQQDPQGTATEAVHDSQGYHVQHVGRQTRRWIKP